jgi:hypothetical protein
MRSLAISVTSSVTKCPRTAYLYVAEEYFQITVTCKHISSRAHNFGIIRKTKVIFLACNCSTVAGVGHSLRRTQCLTVCGFLNYKIYFRFIANIRNILYKPYRPYQTSV